MVQPEKMIIYNLFPSLAGRFSEWESHLRRAGEMGFNWVFVNPIHLTGSSGSLYSIKDYFRINPILIDSDNAKSAEGQAEEANKIAKKLGLRMMVSAVRDRFVFPDLQAGIKTGATITDALFVEELTRSFVSFVGVNTKGGTG